MGNKNSGRLVLSLLAVLAAGCDGSLDLTGRGPSDNQPEDQSPASATAYVELNVRVADAVSAAPGLAPMPQVAHTSAAGLKSYQYLIRSIEICQQLEVQGTGFSASSGCVTLYTGPSYPELEYTLPMDADVALQAEAARDITLGYVDLMDPVSLEQLSQTTAFSADNTGEYNWGLVNWYMPYKIEAEIPMPGGTTAYTRDGTMRAWGSSESGFYFTNEYPGHLTEGPSELAIGMHPNGGNFFRFQAPLRITEGDVTAGTTYKLDLAFSPDGAATALMSPDTNGTFGGGADQIGRNYITDAYYTSFSTPMLDLIPIPHLPQQAVVRETYAADVSRPADAFGFSGDHFEFRIDVYYIEQDPDRTLYGVDTMGIATAQTTQGFLRIPIIQYVEAQQDGSLTLQRSEQVNVVTDFRLLDAVGDTQSATLHCIATSMSPAPEGCSNGHENNSTADPLPLQFTLRARTVLP